MHASQRPATGQQQGVRRHASRADAAAMFTLLTGPQLPERVEAALPEHRERLYPPTETLSMFAAQDMWADGGCQQAVDAAMVKRLIAGLEPGSTDTGAYCKARSRLPLAMISNLARGCGDIVANGAPGVFKEPARTAGALVLALTWAVSWGHTPPSDARVFFIEPVDGAILTSPVRVRMGIERFGITPAGTKGPRRHTAGHHHVLVDVDEPPNMDAPIPRDAHHVHLDAGETEVLLELPPGEHSLQLLLGDEDHEPHAPPLISEKIRVIVR
jgi:hypothetical protein